MLSASLNKTFPSFITLNPRNVYYKIFQEIQEKMEELEQEAASIRQAEEDAHIQLQVARRADREEREKRRKEDLERKKQHAAVRREKQRAMIADARRKEQEMLMQITDAEMKSQLEEEDVVRREEEELMVQEVFEVREGGCTPLVVIV